MSFKFSFRFGAFLAGVCLRPFLFCHWCPFRLSLLLHSIFNFRLNRISSHWNLIYASSTRYQAYTYMYMYVYMKQQNSNKIMRGALSSFQKQQVFNWNFGKHFWVYCFISRQKVEMWYTMRYIIKQLIASHGLFHCANTIDNAISICSLLTRSILSINVWFRVFGISKICFFELSGACIVRKTVLLVN